MYKKKEYNVLNNKSEVEKDNLLSKHFGDLIAGHSLTFCKQASELLYVKQGKNKYNKLICIQHYSTLAGYKNIGQQQEQPQGSIL